MSIDPSAPDPECPMVLNVTTTPNPLICKLLSIEKTEKIPVSPTAIELIGFLGKVVNGMVRLYPSLDLTTYYQFDIDDILYAEPADEAHPTKPTKVVLQGSATVEAVISVGASFLEGVITEIQKKSGELKRLTVPLLKTFEDSGCAIGGGGKGTGFDLDDE